MSKIRVVHLINFDLGVRIHMRNQLHYLKEQGYEVSVVTHPGSYIRKDTITREGIFVKTIPFPSKITPLEDLTSLQSLVRYFRAEKFDVVHTHMIKPGLLGRMAGRMVGVPAIIHTVHGFHFYDEMHPMAIRFFAGIEALGARFCDLLLSQNLEDIQNASKLNICPPEKIRHLGNGIDIGAFHPSRVTPQIVLDKKRELGIPADKKMVVMVGRLVKEKGFYEYYEAARILKDRGVPAVFLSIGAVHDRKGAVDPEMLIKEFGLEGYMLFLGTRNDVVDLMSAMDLLVSASYSEGIPRNVMEAASLGKPVVATRVRGTQEIVDHGSTGLMVPMKDPMALADAIEGVLSDSALASSMGKAARVKAEGMFDERDYFRKIDVSYREMLGRKRPETDWNARLKPITPDRTGRKACIQGNPTEIAVERVPAGGPAVV